MIDPTVVVQHPIQAGIAKGPDGEDEEQEDAETGIKFDAERGFQVRPSGWMDGALILPRNG
jgi:hypothetical protein